MSNPSDQLMTVAEVCAELRLGTSTVWRHVKDGTLPRPIKIGGATRWRRSELHAFIASVSEEREG